MNKLVVVLAAAALLAPSAASARKFSISKSDSTGWYHWECNDGSSSGWSSSRSGARSAGRDACAGNYVVEGPYVLEAEEADVELEMVLVEDEGEKETTKTVVEAIDESDAR